MIIKLVKFDYQSLFDDHLIVDVVGFGPDSSVDFIVLCTLIKLNQETRILYLILESSLFWMTLSCLT